MSMALRSNDPVYKETLPIPGRLLALFVNTWTVKIFLHSAASWLLISSPSMARVVLCRGITASADPSRTPSPGAKAHTALWADVAHGPLWSAAQGGVQQSWLLRNPLPRLFNSHLPFETLQLRTRTAVISCKQGNLHR